MEVPVLVDYMSFQHVQTKFNILTAESLNDFTWNPDFPEMKKTFWSPGLALELSSAARFLPCAIVFSNCMWLSLFPLVPLALPTQYSSFLDSVAPGPERFVVLSPCAVGAHLGSMN